MESLITNLYNDVQTLHNEAKCQYAEHEKCQAVMPMAISAGKELAYGRVLSLLSAYIETEESE